MACSIPPHNLNEVCDAALFLIDNKDKNHNELYNIINGPDFPTGGTVIESKDNIIDTYKNGRGSFRLRANWILEKKSSGTWHICINEIPYQTNIATCLVFLRALGLRVYLRRQVQVFVVFLVLLRVFS